MKFKCYANTKWIFIFIKDFKREKNSQTLLNRKKWGRTGKLKINIILLASKFITDIKLLSIENYKIILLFICSYGGVCTIPQGNMYWTLWIHFIFITSSFTRIQSILLLLETWIIFALEKRRRNFLPLIKNHPFLRHESMCSIPMVS